jgi:hypothetical protein
MSERYKMPSLFLSVKETSAIAGKDMNMNLQNIGGYISKIQVESYFNRNTVSVDSKALKKHTYATGVNDCARRRDYKRKICLLPACKQELL